MRECAASVPVLSTRRPGLIAFRCSLATGRATLENFTFCFGVFLVGVPTFACCGCGCSWLHSTTNHILVRLNLESIDYGSTVLPVGIFIYTACSPRRPHIVPPSWSNRQYARVRDGRQRRHHRRAWETKSVRRDFRALPWAAPVCAGVSQPSRSYPYPSSA